MFKRVLKFFNLYSDALKYFVNWAYASSFGIIRLGWGIKIAKDVLYTDVDMIAEPLLIVVFIMNIAFSWRIIKLAYNDSM